MLARSRQILQTQRIKLVACLLKQQRRKYAAADIKPEPATQPQEKEDLTLPRPPDAADAENKGFPKEVRKYNV